ncbi:SIS domain-containing protein [Octadecabacter ascidiaceicola]|uniref:Glutamine--fructose-6-phosphate aminotransferase [isomerizing] n=1 Tax=Octadecabacter ascidiaceicola TaxID=1655543 RepID=A0A238KQ68_9RHOB|nr:SIS domain-containing protein [Octadecabacter ascidiaceicola]SMX44771.1 Glutamine--fructose-6-phosphate aminotransferase [isomerizing] [Octadecabacter ascidiaceicola]
MTLENKTPGCLMAAESAQCLEVFAKSVTQTVSGPIEMPNAIYTIARGSSDAAANILSYEFMRELGVPMTSLPPSVFSIGDGVAMAGCATLVISQSGASHDLVHSAEGAAKAGARVLALTNQENSAVEKVSDVTLPIDAGPELAVPATKSVVGAVAAGMALLSKLQPSYANRAQHAANAVGEMTLPHGQAAGLQAAFLRARHVYVIGRDTGYGAAHEVALKLKECCAIHAEAYSSSEVLHGPLQLATNPLMVLMLDTGLDDIQDSLDQAEARFRSVDCDVHRVRLSDLGGEAVTPAAAAAVLLAMLYPVILNTALALGLDPDMPETLSKVTKTT